MSNQPFPQPQATNPQHVEEIRDSTAVSDGGGLSPNSHHIGASPIGQVPTPVQYLRQTRSTRASGRARAAAADVSRPGDRHNPGAHGTTQENGLTGAHITLPPHRDNGPSPSSGVGHRGDRHQPRQLLKLKEAAEYLRCSPWRLRNLLHQGRLPFIQDGGGPMYIDRRDLDNYIDRNKRYE